MSGPRVKKKRGEKEKRENSKKITGKNVKKKKKSTYKDSFETTVFEKSLHLDARLRFSLFQMPQGQNDTHDESAYRLVYHFRGGV